MAQIGKASSKRGKPSYVMSIIGVTLVLFLLGLVGWIIINTNKLGDILKNNVEVRAYLRGDLNVKDSTDLMQQIASKAYIKDYKFVNKEAAKAIFMQQDGGEGNKDWEKILAFNPLPNAIFFHVQNPYVELDSLRKIEADLKQNVYVTEVKYPEVAVTNLNQYIKRISMAMLIIAIIIAVAVIFLIDNTIRLAMFSNRFLIKTMQMVGATRWFIARPLNVRAIINGAISAIIAIVLVYLLVLVAQGYFPDLAKLQDTGKMLMLFVVLLLLGISINVISTYRSVLKYLRMKLDELY